MVRGVRRKLREHGLEAPVLLVSAPSGAEMVGQLGERLVVYYVTDEYAELPGVYRAYVESLEERLLAEADLILVTSVSLQSSKRGKKGPTVLLPHGVDFDHFHSATTPRGPIPEELERLPRPILGFFGLLAPWVDTNLLRILARALPQASIVLIGPTWSDFPAPGGAPNLHSLGPRSYADLPRYAAHFDVGLIPFRQDRLTAHVNPLKLLEYLALGLPVVSTPLPDLERVAHVVYQAARSDEFVERVKLALAERTPALRHLRVSLAAGESWDARSRDPVAARARGFGTAVDPVNPLKVCTVFGTRPEAIKLAPVIKCLGRQPGVEQRILLTGQHRELLDQMLELFGIQGARDLRVMQADQRLGALTARVLTEVEQDLVAYRPDWLIVQGDTTSALAAAMAGYYVRHPRGACRSRSSDL